MPNPVAGAVPAAMMGRVHLLVEKAGPDGALPPSLAGVIPRWDTPPGDHALLAIAAQAACPGGTADAPGGEEIPPLRSVYGSLNGRDACGAIGTGGQALPDESKITAEDYQTLLERFAGLLARCPGAAQDPDLLLPMLEQCFSFVPAQPCCPPTQDLSFYDQARLTGAVYSCLLSCRAQGMDAQNPAAETLLLVSCGFSGIQKFIYSIASKRALKSLRSRSFFLDLLMEHCVDELLCAAGLSRACCIYSGGGSAYLLLPNTAPARAAVESLDRSVNGWLREQFGVRLLLTVSSAPCAPNALQDIPKGSYRAIFRALTEQTSAKKLHPYDAAALRALNRGQSPGSRECKTCGCAGSLTGDDLCFWCDAFARLSQPLLGEGAVFAVTGEDCPFPHSLPLPGLDGGKRRLAVATAGAVAEARRVARAYVKNGYCARLPAARRILVADYCPDSLLDNLSGQAQGIRRLGIFRADVDNLGQAFQSGFDRPAGAPGGTGLARTAALSRSLALFFRQTLNGKLQEKHLAVLVVYSGGDDLFLAGAWDAVLDAAQEIRGAFERVSLGSLTLSGGLLLCPEHYPISRAAQDAAALESFSKQHPGKNAVTLFRPEPALRFSWEDYSARVIGEKLACLERFFESEDAERGSVFLHRLLGLVHGVQNGQKIDLARLAFLLARLEPGRGSPARYDEYRRFSQSIYRWATTARDRDELAAAIELYCYLTRKRSDEE